MKSKAEMADMKEDAADAKKGKGPMKGKKGVNPFAKMLKGKK